MCGWAKRLQRTAVPPSSERPRTHRDVRESQVPPLRSLCFPRVGMTDLPGFGLPLLVYNHEILPIMRSFLSLGLLLPLFAYAQTAATKVPAPQTPVPRFKDVAKEAGLTVSHISTPEKKYIVESMSGGAGLIDCDNDGKPDVITVNGSTIDRYRQGGDPMITLYHQDADFKFTDITKAAGLTRRGWGMGVAVADFDMDHLPTFGSDEKNCRFKGILVQCGPWGMIGESDLLFHNRGDGTFEEVSKKAGMEDSNRYYG